MPTASIDVNAFDTPERRYYGRRHRAGTATKLITLRFSTIIGLCIAANLAIADESPFPSGDQATGEDDNNNDHGDQKLLRQIAASVESDYQQIHTLSGTFKVRDFSTMDRASLVSFFEGMGDSLNAPPQFGYRTVHSSVQFYCDLQRSLLFNEYKALQVIVKKPNGSIIPINGTQVAGVPLESSFRQRTVVNHNGYLHIQPNVKYGDIEGITSKTPVYGRVAFKEPTKTATQQHWGSVVSPDIFFNIGRPIWEELRVMADSRDFMDSEEFKNRPKAEQAQFRDALKVRQISSDRILIEISGSKNGMKDVQLVNRLIFAKDHIGYFIEGYQVDEIRNAKSLATKQMVTWEWGEKDGLRIPNSINRSWIAPDGESIRIERGVRIIDPIVNEPIPDGQFSISALELGDGDRLSDRIDKVVYTFRNGELTDPVSFDFQPTPASRDNPNIHRHQGSRMGWMVIVLNAIFVAAVLVYFCVRRKMAIKSK